MRFARTISFYLDPVTRFLEVTYDKRAWLPLNCVGEINKGKTTGNICQKNTTCDISAPRQCVLEERKGKF